jgi:hypothetical protein
MQAPARVRALVLAEAAAAAAQIAHIISNSAGCGLCDTTDPRTREESDGHSYAPAGKNEVITGETKRSAPVDP